MAWQAALLIVGAYLVGSIPTGYLAARLLKGMDLRYYGSGTPTGSMVYEHVARWAVVPVGLIDVGKAALPTWLALQLDLGMGVATAAGLVAVVGHNWPIFLGFIGGRGVSGFLGVLAVLFPLGTAWILGFLLIGWRLDGVDPGQPGRPPRVLVVGRRPGDHAGCGRGHAVAHSGKTGRSESPTVAATRTRPTPCLAAPHALRS